MGFEPTTFPVTGERPLRTGPQGRISCRGGNRTHDDRLIRAVPCRLATPQSELRRVVKDRANSTPCGSRTRPGRLERPPTSPEVERGAYQKRNRPGGRFSPRPARVPQLARGVIRSYPDRDRSSRLRSQDASSPRRSRRLSRRPFGEVHSSRARGSWWYRYVDRVSCVARGLLRPAGRVR
jgi:hypothetical protein